MKLLSVIFEQNAVGKYPNLNELIHQRSIVDSFIKLDIAELMKKGYVDEVSIPDEQNANYDRKGYKITSQGEYSLDKYTSMTTHFASRLIEILGRNNSNDNDNLYHMIEQDRDLLRFAHFKGAITKTHLADIARRLEISENRIWWGERQGEFFSELGMFPP